MEWLDIVSVTLIWIAVIGITVGKVGGAGELCGC
jgi:hypothetical protein